MPDLSIVAAAAVVQSAEVSHCIFVDSFAHVGAKVDQLKEGAPWR